MRQAGVALVLSGFLVTSSSYTGAAGDNWPQWRGPSGRGVSEATNFPAEWSPDQHIAWKTAIVGRGHSSPVVWNDRVFLTTSLEGERVPGHSGPDHLGYDLRPGYVHPDSVGVEFRNALKVLALDAATGRIVWEHTAYDGLMYDNRHRKNTYASSTPVTDGELVYAYFEAAGVYAYDFKGALIWKASIGNVAKGGMGPGTSPVLFNDLLILQADQEMGTGSAIVALDKRTGKEVWRTTRTTRRSWATPLLIEAKGRTELIASGAEMVAGYDPRTGRELWRSRGTESHPIPSAVSGLGLIFFTAGSQAKRAMAVRPGGDGDVTESAIVWSYRKGTAYVPSPILHGNFLYLMTDTGLMTCLDAATGEVKYEGGRPPAPATFTSSLVAYGDRLLLTSEDGDTYVVKAGPVHEVLRTNSVGEPVYASLALANGTIYIRGEKHMFAVR